ncbi:MAG: N-(5'-phosphoribosyl)anthranilate isomerase [Vicinamibacterales bacterium]
MSVRIKICGLTRPDDARLAADLEVDAVGVVLWPGSPRAVGLDAAAALCAELPAFTTRVGVFVSPTPEEATAAVRAIGLGAVQLHGVDDPAPFLALRVPVLWAASLHADRPDPEAPAGTTLLLDAHDPVRHGGTGRTIDWTRARRVAARARRLVLAGGLTAENVSRAIDDVRPWAVDVSSGVEVTPGIKSAVRMKAFVAAVRAAAASTSV